MPAYKDDTMKTWIARFYYENHLGERKQKKKRGFKRKSDAQEFEREFLLKLNGSPEMAFQTLYDDYIEDMAHRLKETTMSEKNTCMKLKYYLTLN